MMYVDHNKIYIWIVGRSLDDLVQIMNGPTETERFSSLESLSIQVQTSTNYETAQKPSSTAFLEQFNHSLAL